MISDEDSETNSSSAFVGEATTHLEENNIVLAQPGAATQSNTAPSQTEQCETIIETSEDVDTTILVTKEPMFTGHLAPATRDSNTVLSLSHGDALNANERPMISARSENNVNFETQAVLSTSESSLLHDLINPSQKQGDLSVSNISNTVIDDDTGTQLDDQDVVTQSEDYAQQDLGDLPPWAARLKGCERIGDSYRGYVHTEAELDILLSMHKEHTHSSWGTRQSPSSQKPSVRFMWKSQYVPYDGIPFLNSGRRATVMECQYGPRRKGNKVKVEYNEDGQRVKRAHRPTCPARIYIKRVRKFPEYKIDKSYEGTPGLRLAQERALTSLRVACLESRGEERFYVQFPLEIAHEYHQDDDDVISDQALSLLPTQLNVGSSRLDPRVVEKINELVARGVTDLYHVKHGVINFVEKDLFLASDEETPARHNKMFFPTITDLQNHIHLAQLALESGTLESLPPISPETLPKSPSKDDHIRKRKRSEPRRVRASKTTPLTTICIRTDDALELGREPSLHDTQGQVYVMVPSSGLFANSESLIGASLPLDGDKAASLVQVLTVPASTSSAFLGRQEGTLDLTGQFLALPVVSCDNQEQISSLQNSTIVLQDSLGKEAITVIPATLGDNQEPSHLTPISPSNITMATAISPSTITMTTSIPQATVTTATPTSPSNVTVATPILPSNVSMSTSISPSTTLATPLSPSTITMATTSSPGLPVTTSETYVNRLEMIAAVPSTVNTNVSQNQNTKTVENMVVSTCSTIIPDSAMTSSEMMTSSNSVGPMTSSEVQMISSSATQMTLDIPITSQYFSMSFVPIAAPDAAAPLKTQDHTTTIIGSTTDSNATTVTHTFATDMTELTNRLPQPTNQQSNLNSSDENVIEASSSLSELFDQAGTPCKDTNPVTNTSSSRKTYDTTDQSTSVQSLGKSNSSSDVN